MVNDNIPWHQLSFDPQKHRFYPGEFESRLAWEDLQIISPESMMTMFHRYTFIIIKPECFKRRLTASILEFLKNHGFAIRSMRLFHFHAANERFVWRYQWNAATTDRQQLSAIKNELDPAAILTLCDERWDGSIPAAVRLHELKGSSAFLDRRRPEQLRSIIGTTNRALTFIHCPDEPADILRETLAFFERGQDFLHDCKIDQDIVDDVPIISNLLSHELNIPAHHLNPQEVSKRRALDLLPERKYRLDDIRTRFGDLCTPAERWDFLTTAANWIQHDRTGEGPTISTKTMPQIVKEWDSFKFQQQ
jgi:hypothetical protein